MNVDECKVMNEGNIMHLMMGWRRCLCLLNVVASQVGYAGNVRFKQLSQQTCYDKILFKLWYYVF